MREPEGASVDPYIETVTVLYTGYSFFLKYIFMRANYKYFLFQSYSLS